MEGSNSSEFKSRPRASLSVGSLPGNGTSSSNGSQWQESYREYRGEHGKKRDHSQDPGWNRDRNYKSKREESRDRCREGQQQQPPQPATSFPSYGYNVSGCGASDHSYVDNNRRPLQIMTYNLMSSPSQQGVGQIDNVTMKQNIAVNPSTTGMTMSSNMEMAQNTGNGGINPFTFMGVPAENNIYGMMGLGNYDINLPVRLGVNPAKKVLHRKMCSLYPPNPNTPLPLTRPRPVGCKTVFVGGLPEKITEEIIREAFTECGEILKIRMGKKHFCHIRFADEAFVDQAIYFSGYRMKIDNKDELPYSGRLHVDYAKAIDDMRDHETKIRKIQREKRHQEDSFRPPTPPAVAYYSEHEAAVLGEKLRGEETFQKALFVLITWLDRGECSKKNSSSFYSFIQSINSHVRRLISEKSKYEDELNKAKLVLKQQMQGILVQFKEIQKVFHAACMQKVWDHFSKSQRKNIEMWKKQTEEIKNAYLEEVLNDRSEDEMDMSDDENEKLDVKYEEDTNEENKDLKEQLCKVREENEKLQKKIITLNNENRKLKNVSESRELFTANLHESFNHVQEIDESKLHRRSMENGGNIQDANNDHVELNEEVVSVAYNFSESSHEARLISLISIFLNVHPFGAHVDYISSFISQIDRSVLTSDITNLMRRFPKIFEEQSTGVGANLERKWVYSGYKP